MKIRRNIKTALGCVAVLWLVYFLDVILPVNLKFYGLQPRRIDSLWHIPLSPLLHINLGHLVANTGALFVLLVVSLSFSRKLTIRALLIIVFVGGGLVWLSGKSNTIHIGASGIIFGLIGFMMFIGVFRREWIALIVSLAIFFCYGGVLLSLLVHQPGISWEGHFFGFLTGVMAAWWTKAQKHK